ncbi:hypothetical protein [Halovivax gelatinilyticus]|uniref:hypothetical protein n=1 Tax=Halovivax gelatinilyticus TaxID=2961597 RepID=UPI0020CA47A5|nr:hypothetical protein [Halovivax gelatinilyticus]
MAGCSDRDVVRVLIFACLLATFLALIGLGAISSSVAESDTDSSYESYWLGEEIIITDGVDEGHIYEIMNDGALYWQLEPTEVSEDTWGVKFDSGILEEGGGWELNNATSRESVQEFSIHQQTLHVDVWPGEDEYPVYVESSRHGYNLVTDVSSFDDDTVEAIFGEITGVEISEDEVMIPDLYSSDSFVLDLSSVGQLNYEFEFSVEDTTATDSAVVVQDTDPAFEFSFDNTGEVYSVGIPGEVDGTYRDLITEGMDGVGVMYEFDGESNSWSQITGSDFDLSPEPLQAIILVTTGEGPDEITVELPFESESTVAPGDFSVSERWEFMSGIAFNDANLVYQAGTAESSLILDRYSGPGDSIFTHDVQSFQRQIGTSYHYIGSDTAPEVNPFNGYFVYVQDEGAIPGVLTGVTDIEEAMNQLGAKPGWYDGGV